MRNRVGECSKNQTLKKMQVNIPCRCMHEREMVMQSGERGNLAVLLLLVCVPMYVCVCVCKEYTHTQYLLNNHMAAHDAPFSSFCTPTEV